MSASRLQPPLITLTTDFGLVDTYVGVMKGVIYSIAPDARLVDLTHEVSPQNVLEASARLEASINYFPNGTIHLVVVDPGVGSNRAACVVQTDRALFVAPDNGVLTLPLQRSVVIRAVRLTDKAHSYCLPRISATFHGRDVFAPVAAYLAKGLELEALGDEIAPDELVTLPLSLPESGQDENGFACLSLRVLYADRLETWLPIWSAPFGKGGELDVPKAKAPFKAETQDTNVRIQAGAQAWQGIAHTFADVLPGQLLAYWGSDGRLEIGVRDGNAAHTLSLSTGDTLTMCLKTSRAAG